MIRYPYIFILFLLLLACQREVNLSTQACDLPTKNNYDQHRLSNQFQALLDKKVKEGLPGVVMVVETPTDGKWVGASGLAKLENQQAMNPCHVFHSASVAKTYHVVAAMTLVEEGKLELDQTIDQYLPDWVCQDLANRNTATIRQLMNHTSGIPDFIEDADHVMDYFNSLMRTFTTKDYLNYVCGDKPDFEPGKGISYSNTNTVLLALIMDEVAGAHEDVVTDKIIKKLNLQQTYYKNEEGYPAPKYAVNTYLDIKGDGVLSNATEIERNFDRMNIGHDAMLASAEDFAQFIKALFQGKLVSLDYVNEMSDYVPYTEGRGFGLGLEVIESKKYKCRIIGHEGSSLGARNVVFYIPEKEITIVICSNHGGFLGGPIEKTFISLFRELWVILFPD